MVKVGVSKCLRAGILVFVMAVVFGSCVGLGQTSGGSIVLGLDVDVATFDPRMRINTVELRMMELIFDGLIEISPEGNIAPDLATSWEQLDLTTWLFHLNQGVKFHDGSELTAEDVKFTYDTILAPGFGSTMASSYTAIAAIDVIDTYTVSLDSTSKCNCQGGICGEEYLVWGSKAKCLSRPMIEPLHCFVDLFPGNTC